MNRAERRASRGYVVTGTRPSFGPWQNRDDTLTHPMAPDGVRHAYSNAKYSVLEFHADTRSVFGTVTLLMIRRHDGAPITQWYELQRIKDEIAGANRTAVQVFPPHEQLRDSANLYHLWVMPEGMALPFGLHLPEQWQ